MVGDATLSRGEAIKFPPGGDTLPKPPKTSVPAFPPPPTPLALIPPNIETRSSSGFVEVPDSKLAAAVDEGKICVAARPEGCPSWVGPSSKSSRFSACWPATTVWRAFCAVKRSSDSLQTAVSEELGMQKEQTDSAPLR